MALDKRVTSVLDGSTAAFTDRTLQAVQFGVFNVAGSGAGASVSTVVTFAEPLPAEFGVWIGVRQDATGFVSAQTSDSLTITLNPRLSTNTLAAGTFDVLVLG